MHAFDAVGKGGLVHVARIGHHYGLGFIYGSIDNRPAIVDLREEALFIIHSCL